MNTRRLVLMAVAALLLLPGGIANAAITSSVVGGVLTITGSASADVITVSCTGGSVKINGIDPGSGAALCVNIELIKVQAGRGNDMVTVSTGAGVAEVNGGDGSDTLTANIPNTMRGGTGDDTFTGVVNVVDTMIGGGGNDYFIPRGGNDVVSGGRGVDLIYGYGASAWTLTNTKLIGEGTDTLSGVEKAKLEGAGAAADAIDASKFAGKAELLGEGGADLLIGGSGNDQLLGGDGDDVLQGGGGNDDLDGGLNIDSCAGGPGQDNLSNCE